MEARSLEEKVRRIGFAVILSLLVVGVADAAEFPTKAIRILVPYQAGGLVDLAARKIAGEVQKKWKQPVVIENRPGASGALAVRAAADAEADGYTWLMTTNSEFTINPAILPGITYDLDRDFNAITMIVDSPLAIVAPLQAPFDNVQALTAFAKGQSGPMLYASPGTGTLNNLLSEWFAGTQQFMVQHIPYKGGAPSITAILSNEVQFGALSLAVSKSLAESGKLKMLAVSSPERSVLAPNVPTLVESSVPISATIWVGLFTQKNVPKAINAAIQDLVVDILNTKDMRAQFIARGVEARPMSAQDFYRRIKTEEKQFREVIQTARIGQ